MMSLAMSLASTLPLALFLAFPTIASNSSCPSARDVEANLSVLMSVQSSPPGTARVVGLPDSLIVELHPETVSGTTSRLIEVGRACDDRAKAAALLIATWWPNERGQSPSTESLAALPQSMPPRQLALSAGLLASGIPDGVAAGIRAEISGNWSKLGLRLSPSGTAAHQASLGRGRVEWQRLSLEVGPTYGWRRLRLDAGFVASMLAVSGTGYSQNQRSSGAAMGATGGVRISSTWGRLLPWLEVRALWWPQSQRIYVLDAATGTESSHDLPHVELQLAIGIAWSIL